MKSNQTIINEGEWYEICNFKLIHKFGIIKITRNHYHVIPKENTFIIKIEANGINIATSLSYIYSATMIARDVTSSSDYGPRNLLWFIYYLHNRPRSSIIEEYLNPGSGSEEENIQLNIEIQHIRRRCGQFHSSS